jgi:hypothetical protein
MNNDIFKNAYLAQLGLIKEEDMQPVVPGAEGAETAAEEAEVKQVTFLTSDPAVLDAFNKGFEEVVFFVKSVDEATGEETIEEVKIGADSFADFTINDVTEEIEECNEIKEDVEEEIEDEELIEEDEDADLADDEDFAEDAEIEDEEIEEAISHKF